MILAEHADLLKHCSEVSCVVRRARDYILGAQSMNIPLQRRRYPGEEPGSRLIQCVSSDEGRPFDAEKFLLER